MKVFLNFGHNIGLYAPISISIPRIGHQVDHAARRVRVSAGPGNARDTAPDDVEALVPSRETALGALGVASDEHGLAPDVQGPRGEREDFRDLGRDEGQAAGVDGEHSTAPAP